MNSQISLRYKLLIPLILLPIGSLIIYLIMATNLFIEDKRAYIFDSSVLISSSLATQIKMEIKSFKRTIDPILEGVNHTNFKFNDFSKTLFNTQKKIEHIIVYKPINGGVYRITDHIKANGREVREPQNNPEQLTLMQRTAIANGLVMVEYPEKSTFFMIMESHNPVTDKNHFLTLSIFKSQDVYEAFATPTMFKNYVISKSGQFCIQPKISRDFQDKIQIESIDFFKPIINQKLPQGATEVQNESDRPALIAFSDVGEGDMMVASVVDKKQAFLAIDRLITKSLLFLLALVSITVIVSVIISVGLTSALSALLEATEEIGKGNFELDLPTESNDEIGELSRRFKTMAGKISSLIKATAEKARMEHELETVKVVQETLFPEMEMETDKFKIVSHYEPASECGGDWFHYNRIGNKAFLWIGDATGHGAPAALITSAAKSASSIIESLKIEDPGEALEMMSRALHGTAKGKVLMTFFLAVIDLESGIMKYSNASHEFPYVIPERQDIKKKDLIPLCEVSGMRLGESTDAIYRVSEYQLKSGDNLFFFTDGIMDLENKEGKSLGERGFLQQLIKAHSSSNYVNSKVETLKSSLTSFRSGTSLVDDITFFWFQYNE